MKGCCFPSWCSILIAVAFVGCGCSQSSPWSFDRYPRSTPHEQTSRSTEPANTGRTNQRRTAAAGGVPIVHVAFDVLRIDIPVESIRHSCKIWNHVDELQIGPQTVALLARNGLRVGAASPAAWPAIEAILESAGAESRSEQMFTHQGLPVCVVISSIDAGETFFTYDRDGRLVGKTFPAGDKLLGWDYAFHPELGGCTELQLTLEVRHDRGELTWERQDDAVRQVPAYDRHVFADLIVPISLNPGEFVAIGPGDEMDNEYLIGSRFFAGKRSGRAYETIFCITPRPYRTTTSGQPGLLRN